MLTVVEMYPTVKAYPVIDAGLHGEAVCVAGVTASEPRQWIRLYPLDFRSLPANRRFAKWQPIRLSARAPRNDTRPESRTPVLETIEILGQPLDTDNQTWRRRLRLLAPLMLDSLCDLKRKERQDRTSLGVFRPADIDALRITSVDPVRLAAKSAIAEQQSFFDERTNRLVPVPWKFKYRFRCADPRCPGHEMSYIDWEIGALWWRASRARDVTDDDVKRVLYERFFESVCAADRDVAFIVGNIAAHPLSFLVLGVVWPLREPPALFDADAAQR